MSLSRSEIIDRIYFETNFEKCLVITPLLNPRIQIGESSIDIRLGFSFLKTSREHISHVDALDKTLFVNVESSYGKILSYPFWTKKRMTLHPGDFLLGSALEYIKLPKDVVGFISGRSSWARLGIIIHATGGIIHPSIDFTMKKSQ